MGRFALALLPLCAVTVGAILPHSLVANRHYSRGSTRVGWVRRLAREGGGGDVDIDDDLDDAKVAKSKRVSQKLNRTALPVASTPPSSRPFLGDLRDAFEDRLNSLQWTEIRLDVSLLWCHVLCRGLIAEILTRPPKLCRPQCPGLYYDDIAVLFKIASSAAALSVLWVAAGALVTELYFTHKADAQDDGDGDDDGKLLGRNGVSIGQSGEGLWRYLGPTFATVLIAGPLWAASDDAEWARSSLAAVLLEASTTAGGVSGVTTGGGGASSLFPVPAMAPSQLQLQLQFPLPEAAEVAAHIATAVGAVLGLGATTASARLLALWVL